MKPLLTIAIPTFNRRIPLRRQVAWVLNEIEACGDAVRFMVSDNASDDGSWEELEKAVGGTNAILFRQPENLGLIGNYRFVIEKCETPFLWILSDDDFVKPGTVAKICDLLREHSPGLIHLSWGAAVIDDAALSARPVVENCYGYSAQMLPEKGHQSCLTLAGIECGGLMFMSANILDTESARRSLAQFSGKADNLALPIWVAVFCSWRRGYLFVKETLVYCRHGEPRWSDSYLSLFFGDIPRIFQEMMGLGISRLTVFKKHVSLLSRNFLNYVRANPRSFAASWLACPWRMLVHRSLREEGRTG